MRDIVDAIQISVAFLVEHVLTLTSNDFQRIRFVKQFAGFSIRRGKTMKKNILNKGFRSKLKSTIKRHNE